MQNRFGCSLQYHLGVKKKTLVTTSSQHFRHFSPGWLSSFVASKLGNTHVQSVKREANSIRNSNLDATVFHGYQIVGRVSMKTQYIVVRCDYKTKDDVFVTVVTSIHYGVLDVPDKNNAKKAFYVHNDPKSLIEAHSFSAVKTVISSFTFDELFEKKDGFGNFQTLILDIAPDDYAKRIIRLTNAASKMAVALTGATFHSE